MTDDHRERRVADAAKLLGAIEPYTKVKSDARIAAVHNELIFAIERTLNQHAKHRFQQDEIEVLKDIAFQIVFLLDPMNRPRRGIFPRRWIEFCQESLIKRVGMVAAVLVFLSSSAAGIWSFYEKFIKPADSTANIPHNIEPPKVPPPMTLPAVTPPATIPAPTRSAE